MEKYKYLLKNIGLLVLSNLSTKLLGFLLVPLYTSILTTKEYGIYDLFNTTIGVLIPIFTVNAVEFVLRYALDKNYDRNAIVTIGTKWMIIGSAIVIIGLAVNEVFDFIPILKDYSGYFFLMYFSQALSGMVTAYARGTDHVGSLSVSSIISSFFTLICNIIFLIPLKMGLSGYFLANIIGPIVQSIYLIFRTNINYNLNFHKKFRNEEKEMLSYSIPTIINSISWWINTVSDKYIVIFFCGLAENGIYSVSSKIPSILNVFQLIFNQAWDLSVVKDYDPNDKENFFSTTYQTYNGLLVIVCSLIIMGDRILARFIYADNFYVAWKYVPFLTIAVLFNALVGFLGGFFTAVKDSKAYSVASVAGAITNITLNFILIPVIGTMGAALSTAICYIEAWIIRLVQSKKYIHFKINIFRDCISYVLLFLQAILLLCMKESWIMYFIQMLIFSTILILYKNNIKLLLDKALKK